MAGNRHARGPAYGLSDGQAIEQAVTGTPVTSRVHHYVTWRMASWLAAGALEHARAASTPLKLNSYDAVGRLIKAA